jgi:hypothetical protein
MSYRFLKLKALLIVIFPFVVSAQTRDIPNGKESIPGVEGFKSWLSHSWLKKDILFDTTEIVNNKIYLTLTLACINDCTSKWERIKSSFDSLASIPFETYLWNKANFHFEVPNNTLIIEIYNKTPPYETPCFLRSIYYRDSIQISKADCKDIGGQSSLNYDKFNPTFPMQKLSVRAIDKIASQIIDTIFAKSEKYFKSKSKEVEIIKSKVESHKIVFTVRNLKSEVIKHGGATIEKIEITIICNFHSDYVAFETIMNGKYGSWKIKPVSDKGLNDMEDDYKPEFQNYVDDFTNNKLLRWLR